MGRKKQKIELIEKGKKKDCTGSTENEGTRVRGDEEVEKKKSEARVTMDDDALLPQLKNPYQETTGNDDLGLENCMRYVFSPEFQDFCQKIIGDNLPVPPSLQPPPLPPAVPPVSGFLHEGSEKTTSAKLKMELIERGKRALRLEKKKDSTRSTENEGTRAPPQKKSEARRTELLGSIDDDALPPQFKNLYEEIMGNNDLDFSPQFQDFGQEMDGSNRMEEKYLQPPPLPLAAPPISGFLDEGSDGPTTSVLMLQAAVIGLGRALIEKQIAEKKSAPDEPFELTVTAQALLQHKNYLIAGYSSSVVKSDKDEGEETFFQLSNDEHKKSDEEVKIALNTAKKETSLTTQVVTVLVSVKGEHELPVINSSKAMDGALKKLASIPLILSRCFEVIWSPKDEDGTLSMTDMLGHYPSLKIV